MRQRAFTLIEVAIILVMFPDIIYTSCCNVPENVGTLPLPA